MKKPKKKNTHDEEFTDESSEFLKSAAKINFSLNDQLQVAEKILEEFNDFIKKRDDEIDIVIDVFRTTSNFDSSGYKLSISFNSISRKYVEIRLTNFHNDICNIVMAFLDNLFAT